MRYKNNVMVLLVGVFMLMVANSLYGQNLNPCSPTTTPMPCRSTWQPPNTTNPCDLCEGTPYTVKTLTVATFGFTGCIWEVQYRTRCCDGSLEIKIDWIKKSYPLAVCSCNGSEGSSGMWSEIARTVEFEIMRFESVRFSCPLPKVFNVNRPSCWSSRTVLNGGGGPSGGNGNTAEIYLEPCPTSGCCLTRYVEVTQQPGGTRCLNLVNGPCRFGVLCEPGCTDVCD